MEANSVDSLVTDPPYGWRFMGKAWDVFDIQQNYETRIAEEIRRKGKADKYVPALASGIYDQSLQGNLAFQSWTEAWAREAYRVLKPGAHMLVFCGPRTYHRMASGVEDAGFEIRDQMQWLFGSGFPKSLDISKAIDKAAGAEREVVGPSARHAGTTRSSAPIADLARYSDAGNFITAPSTDAAKHWQGYGTALKPANEPILLARKPLSEKTVAANVLKWGCGGLNIDGCRVEGKLEGDPNRFSKAYSMGEGNEGWKRPSHETYTPPVVRTEGRFPANLVFSHNGDCVDITQTNADRTMTVASFECTPGCAVAGLDEQSGTLKSGTPSGIRGPDKYGFTSHEGTKLTGFGDSGGASRFFYCAKASKSERNAGCEGLEEKESYYMQTGSGKPSMSDGHTGKSTARANHHPTVKPLKLMRYLIRLVTPPNGIVLDPFMGSGSTGVAAEQEGFQFIGIEKEKEYIAIAEKRMAVVCE